MSDLYNVVPTKFGQTNNYVTFAGKFGEQYQRYNGLMINVSARPRNGLTVQGGVNTGTTVTDNCEIRALLPEVGGRPTRTATAIRDWSRAPADWRRTPFRSIDVLVERHVPQRSGPGAGGQLRGSERPGRAVARPAGGRQRGQRDGEPAGAR